MKIDLHTHSNKSDGTLSPTELVHHAIINGITILGLSDHDTIAGWQEASSAVRGELQLALGAEISCMTEDHRSVHILALLFDGANQPLQECLKISRDDRIPRMQQMIKLLAQDGFDISFDDVMAAKPEGATLGRPHLADALVAKSIVKNRDQAFAELLNNDSKYYVSHISPTPEAAVALIKAAGGVSIIAHPYASFRNIGLTDEFMTRLKTAGLNGIEVNHRDHSPTEREELVKQAEEFDLVITGSSDFHGSGKLNVIGENVTAPEQWQRLESEASARRLIKGR